MTAILATISTAWKWLWKTRIDLPPIPVGLFAISLIGLVSLGPWVMGRVRDALTPDPVPVADTCISAPVGLNFALIPTQLGWPAFEVSGDQLKLALWQDNQWRRYTYRIASSKRVRPFAGMQVSTLGYGPYIGFEAAKGRLNLSVDVGRTLAAFGPNVGVRPWHVRAGLRLMF